AYSAPAARGPLAIADSPIPDSVLAADSMRVNRSPEVSPLETTSTMTRLPPVDAQATYTVEAPPLPPVTTPAIAVSTHPSQTTRLCHPVRCCGPITNMP